MNKEGPRDGIQYHSCSSTNNAHIYEHDPTYYYPDGNIVFVVEEVLFKLHVSLILPADAILSPVEGGQRYPLGVKNLPEKLTDSSDTKPIKLSDVTKNQFRHYLVALLGRPYTAEFHAIFTDTNTKIKHDRDLLVSFLDITHVSHRFGMSELKEWAFSQLELAFDSIYDLAELSWDKDTLLQINKHARSCDRPKFRSQVTNFIQYFVSIWTVPEDRPSDHEHASCNLDTCVQLFNDSNLPNDDPALFGCIFACILSLGHRSTAWTSGVPRGIRSMLCVAQVELVTLHKELESVAWLGNPHPWQLIVWICRQCHDEFKVSWDNSFGKCKDLGSDAPLKGMINLARLPQYRWLFLNEWKSEFAPHRITSGPLDHSVTRFLSNSAFKRKFSEPTYLYLNLPGDTRPRDRVRCAESEWPLGYLDYHIQLVYQELAKRFKETVLFGEEELKCVIQ